MDNKLGQTIEQKEVFGARPLRPCHWLIVVDESLLLDNQNKQM